MLILSLFHLLKCHLKLLNQSVILCCDRYHINSPLYINAFNDISGLVLCFVSATPFEDFCDAMKSLFIHRTIFVSAGLSSLWPGRWSTCSRQCLHTRSDILSNEELGTCLSDSVPWRLPLDESIYVSYDQDDPELCRGWLSCCCIFCFDLCATWWDSGLNHCSSIIVLSLHATISPTICSVACWNVL